MRINQAREAILRIWPLNWSILLVGETGVGKSYLVSQIAKEKDYRLVTLRPGHQETGDLIGMPQIVNGRTEWAPPSWWPKEGKQVLLLVDEFNRGTRQVTQAMFQLVLDRRLHTHELPAATKIIAAMNPETSSYDVTPLDDALLTRFVHIHIENNADDFILWAANQKICSAVPEFIQSNPRYLQRLSNSENYAKLFPTPRGWHMVACVTEVILGKNPHDWNLLTELASGIVGEDAGAKYVKYLKSGLESVQLGSLLKSSIDDIKKIIKSLKNSQLTHLVNQFLWMDEGLMKVVLARPEYVEKVRLIARRMPLDFLVHLMTGLADRVISQSSDFYGRLFNELVRDPTICKSIKNDLLEYWFQEQEKHRAEQEKATASLSQRDQMVIRQELEKSGVDFTRIKQNYYWERLSEQTFQRFVKWLNQPKSGDIVRLLLEIKLPRQGTEKLFEVLPEKFLRDLVRHQEIDPVLLLGDWERLPPEAREVALASGKIPNVYFHEVALDAIRLYLQSKRDGNVAKGALT